MNGVAVHPPLFTKVMGRPKRNRKKGVKETIKKGVKHITKHGVTMHCSICGKVDHNKKGHNKFMESQRTVQEGVVVAEEGYKDDPSYLQHIMPQNANPTMDPTHQVEIMVYKIGQEERQHISINMTKGPLPEANEEQEDRTTGADEVHTICSLVMMKASKPTSPRS
uniref:Uncharacterized protein n=1 Tax=Avena sativa TaxID=4498 RepID=A0ACD5Z805_AVESA